MLRRATVIVVALFALLISGCSDGEGNDPHESYPSPEQPDPALAASIESALVTLPGVVDVSVINEVECIDLCKGSRPNYAADVTVGETATGVEIAAVVAAHHQAYAAAGLLPDEEKVSISRGEEVSLDVVAPSTSITSELASGFVHAADAGYPVHVRVNESTKMSVTLEHLDSCAKADEVAASAHSALSQASSAAGLPFATLSVSCGRWADISLPVMAGSVFVPGWGEALESINALSFETDRPEGTIQDFYVDPNTDGTVRVYVEVNSGFKLTDDELGVLNKLVADVQTLGAPAAKLEINQF